MKQLRSIFILALGLLVFNGCKDDAKVTPADPSPTAPYYFSAKIDGQNILIQDLKDGYGSGVGAGSGSGTTQNVFTQEQSMLLANPMTQKSSGISIVKLFQNRPTVCSEMEAMFHLGAYSFGSSTANKPDANGVVVFHADENGKYWRSDMGSADQTGSSFEIVEHIANNDGFSQRISKAKFNCKLYDAQGNSKTLTNGEIRGRSVMCSHL